MVLSDQKQLERIYELVKSNQNLITYKLKDEDCIRIEGRKQYLDLVEDEIKTHHHGLRTSRRDNCIKVCLRPSFSEVMSDSVHEHHYAEMEE
jgi:hypothetical protein